MSLFSQLLTEYIHRKNIRTYSLAEYCGIDPSMMYKIIRGKRTPASIDTIDKISAFLKLTPGEYKELRTAYQITQVGYENYYRRRDMFDFLNNFQEIANIGSLAPSFMTMSEYPNPLVALNNETEVNHAVFTAVTSQIQKGQGRIRMLVRPDYQFLIHLLTSASPGGSNLVISHMICLNNTEQVTAAKKNYNLHCLMNILPLCACGYQYQPRYYYENVSSQLETFPLFPYLILTDEYAVVLSGTLQAGFLTRQQDLLAMLSRIFGHAAALSRPLLTKIDNIYDQLKYVQQILDADSAIEFTFQMTPCMTALLPAHYLDKYINPQLPSREIFIKHFEAHIRGTYARHVQRNHVLIFSEEGIQEFLQTGHLEEYPSYVYTPFEKEDRIHLIRLLVGELRSGLYQMRMLKQSIGSVRSGANIYITPNAGYLLFTPLNSGTPIYLNIEEAGLLQTFLDFFDTMEESLFYSPEETINRLELLLQEYTS